VSTMIDLIRDLEPIRSGTVCDGADHVMARLQKELPFAIHEFASGTDHNGWTVPWKWDCQKATIDRCFGHLQEQIYDGNAHPLGVASYSDEFTGDVTGAVLKQHLFYSDTYDDALIYHCDWWYKPHARTWGFCVTKRFYESIEDASTYFVDLKTTFTPGTMKVAEYVLPGASEESIVINAHTCHPGCANDDLSGVAVGIEVMRFLATLPARKYTYRLICAPEHYGSIFYLQRFGSAHILNALFLESLGTSGPLALQHSFRGDTLIDAALKNVLRGTKHYTGEFRSIVGNDETCWEAAGHEIPCPSLSRCPFPEYHTSRDNADLMDEHQLEEAVWVVSSCLVTLEHNAYPRRTFTGLVCLSNPEIDLYKPYFDPSIEGRRTIDAEAKAWNRLMNHLPMHFDGSQSLIRLAERFDVKFADLYEYVRQWEQKGLVKLHEVPWHRAVLNGAPL
jgi:aminopeptidase-like protein